MKKFTLKVIVQGLFTIYNQELKFDPLKIKDEILMTFIGKVIFNIGGLTIHFTLNMGVGMVGWTNFRITRVLFL
jgi:hypothetical protein